MDDAVDQQYRNKHFPRSLAPRPAGAAHAAPVSTGSDGVNDGLKGVIASFAGLHMEPAPPPVEGAPAPPCPLAALPEEILVHILRDVAVLDVAAFVRLAQVCRKLAYLVATEHRIWRRVCLGPEFGFGGMHYHFATRLTWEPLAGEHLARHARQSEAATRALLGRAYGASWQCMFRQRPRVRFNGCYIATVNYIRQGLAGAHQVTWDSPVHIVTYYRYLRFFRDGTCVSLLTTAEPADVVHQLTREAVTMHAGGGKAGAHLPSYVVAQALRGRWRLADPAGLVLGDGKGDGDCVAPEATAGSAVAGASAGAGAGEVEGDLFVETEGVGKYMYRMDLSLRNAGKGTRNNKLVWRAFYSYNRLTDDWAEFGLRNDKPFFFSRVKSYGMGE